MSVTPLIPQRDLVVVALPRWLAVRAEQVALAVFVSAAALLRLLSVFWYRIDSDEPQHLHIVWGWSHGLLQYRDIFDNHMPLFHILAAPLLRLVGERADALIAMRLAMLPLYLATIILTYRVAASCHARRAAIWSTLLASLIPGYLLCSTEFRTDDLWTVFWLLAIAILVSAPLTNARAAAAGLALGLAAAVSAKTSLLLVSLAVGALSMTASPNYSRERRTAVIHALVFMAAVAMPVVGVAFYFAARGAWHPFFYGTVSHNIVGHINGSRLMMFPCFLVLICFFARGALASPRRLFLFVTAHFYAASLFCLWPIVEREHWLPYYPLAAITIVPALRLRHMMAIALMEIALVIGLGRLWHDETRDGLSVIEQTLQLTAPDESVMDLKGETVFRSRAFFYVLEPLTKYRIRMGQLRDSIIADILRTKTMVVVQDHHGFPRNSRRFLRKNFVSVGALRVAGRILRPGETSFQIELPAEYAVVGEKKLFDGLLDGRTYSGPRYLVAGVHTLDPAPRDDALALLWSRAAAHGLTPFGLPKSPRRKLSPFLNVGKTIKGTEDCLERRFNAQANDLHRHSHHRHGGQRLSRKAGPQECPARAHRQPIAGYPQWQHHGDHLESSDSGRVGTNRKWGVGQR